MLATVGASGRPRNALISRTESGVRVLRAREGWIVHLARVGRVAVIAGAPCVYY
jgi:hypothetical protein